MTDGKILDVFDTGFQPRKNEIKEKIPGKDEVDASIANRMPGVAAGIAAPPRPNLVLKIRTGTFIFQEIHQVFFVAWTWPADVPSAHRIVLADLVILHLSTWSIIWPSTLASFSNNGFESARPFPVSLSR